MQRRSFLKNSVIFGAGVIVSANSLFANKGAKMQNLVPNYELNNGVKIPILGYGTWDIRGKDGLRAIENALEVGYRHIDSAQYYRNEDIVGEAVRNSGIKRYEIFVTSKLQWGANVGKEGAKRAVYESLDALKFDYIDLYLIHAPYGDIKGIWAGFCELVEQGLVKSIGVSNFSVDLVRELCDEFSIKPVLNQIELHPFKQQIRAQNGLDKLGVATQAYSPFGSGSSKILKNETLQKIGEKYGKTAAQVILRWQIQRNIITIPKTATKSRMIENISIFDFNLSDDDMKKIANLEKF
ncbi:MULTISPECIES: aldo/keto reductase [unclassified Campylobacter]|uniref:aldo/keto reductase n=1 Tax=unclassified Campylobacter TaxID=2593542 RepID=UPI0022E9DFCE|nr:MULTISPECIES: aldo/keto reductase [unclassified Campylobacter]MDA3043794.1 aldo/keto reductase [Campylobacter sp. JMF_09 ED2]MDA3044069.1 aldo/keto reductase [Campylobacter sp. JMF_07 ED4]MDA3063996.1 aldo/keto reductase [Campylobacter sp. JMF_11 EL3]MDA3072404.1 aldo/keto reductase [Campylobacter sp. VBCF_03 NA9]MDA3074973.1 aldo/keto reductase [Campylobacter sp. JMF_05 ED3]